MFPRQDFYKNILGVRQGRGIEQRENVGFNAISTMIQSTVQILNSNDP
jgi:hypothetical protein